MIFKGRRDAVVKRVSIWTAAATGIGAVLYAKWR